MAYLEPTEIASTEIDMVGIEQRARAMRAATVAAFFSGVRQWLARAVFGLIDHGDGGVAPLYAMTDRELSDIGITRDDIDSIAAGTFEDHHGRMAPAQAWQEQRHAV